MGLLVRNVLNNLAKAAENVEKLEPVNSKERLETWKFAAEEIVDLLKTIRQEGEGGTVNSTKALFHAQNQLASPLRLFASN